MSETTSKLSAWWQLLRAGNFFTAVSNVIAGFLLAQGSWNQSAALLLAVAASALLYEAGMVLNDVFDAKLDAIERPERPIPAGRIPRLLALEVGGALLIAGLVASVLAGMWAKNGDPAFAGGALAVCIVLYDVSLKSTFLGPWVMGGCRVLNVMLGVTAVGPNRMAGVWLYAVFVGVYTVGLTYYARTENQTGRTLGQVVGASIVCGTTFCLSFWYGKSTGNGAIVLESLLLLNAFLWIDKSWVSSSPLSSAVQRRRVGRMIMGFIVIDALSVGLLVAWQAGLAILSLLIFARIAARFAPMT